MSSFTTSQVLTGPFQSPDATPLVSLTLYDKNPVTIYNNALALAQQLFPDWNPVTGNTEVTLLQATSTIAAEDVYAINRLPNTMIQAMLQLVGIARSPGVQATASATFGLADSLGHTVPAGTTVQLQLSANQAYNFTTNQDLIVPTGQASATIGITCTAYAAAPNLTPAGTSLTLTSSVGVWINDVTLATTVVGGVDPEDTTSWMQRGVQQLQALNATLNLPVQFQQAALTNPSVFRCMVTNNWNPYLSTGASAAGPGASATGYLAVWVYGQDGASCTPSVMSALQTQLSSQGAAQLNVGVVAPTITQVNVNCTVMRQAGFLDSDVVLSVTQALQNWLDTDTWMWDGTVRYMKAIDIIENAGGVDYLTNLTLNNGLGDIQLRGIANLANAGSVVVNVTDPSTGPTTGTVVNVTATVYKSGGSDSSVSTAVSAAITTFLNAQIPAGYISHTQLISTIAQVANVSYVSSCDINGQPFGFTVTPSTTTIGSITISMGN